MYGQRHCIMVHKLKHILYFVKSVSDHICYIIYGKTFRDKDFLKIILKDSYFIYTNKGYLY